MPTTTANLLLTKPAGGEPALISVINTNMDILDNAVTLTGGQSLSNKTLTAPHMTSPVVDSGGLVVTAGGLTITGGNVGIGVAPLTTVGQYINGPTSGGGWQYGLVARPVASSAATNEVTAIQGQAETAAAVFTSTLVADFHAVNPVKGAGSTITTAYGLLVDAITAGTTNYGIFVAGGGVCIEDGGLTVTAGNVGIGGAPGVNKGIFVTSANLLAADQVGIQSAVVASSGATSSVSGVLSNPGTAAAAFTASVVAAFRASSPVKGAGSTIANAYGLLVDPITSGNTNNYGVLIGASSGGSGENVALKVLGTTHFNADVTFNGTFRAIGFATFTAGCKYVVYDSATGQFKQSAIGPAS